MKKTLTAFLLTTILSFLSFLMVSCEQAEDVTAAYLEVESEKELLCSFDESEYAINIKSNSSWKISISDNVDWLSLNEFAGMNDATVILTVAENISVSGRTAVINISLMDKSASTDITVTQQHNGDIDVFERIEDSNFREYCKQFDLDGDEKLSLEEASQILYIDLTPGAYDAPQQLISSLKGIEYFPNLISLAFGNNVVTEIDLSGNAKLKELIAVRNRLKAIDVTHCPELEYLYISENPEISEIDVTNNPKLIVLSTEQDSLISSIDLSNCPDLTDLSMVGNSISEIDFSANTKLKNIGLDLNRLSSIDVSMLPSLERLNLTSNNISGKIDVTNNPGLLVLSISDNSITSVDVSRCPELNTFYCTSNQLQEIDLSKNGKLTSFHCSDNLFRSVDISGCPDMVQFLCNNQAYLEDIDISECNPDILVSFTAYENPELQTIWVWDGFTDIPSYWTIQDGVEFRNH